MLILDESDALNPGYAEVSNAFRSVLVAKSPVHVYAMNLDLNNFSSPRYRATLRKFIRERYDDIPIGVLFAVGSHAFEFALQLRTDGWADVPIVFAAVAEGAVARLLDGTTQPNVTGRTLQLSAATSVEVARALVPDLKQIALIGDSLEKQRIRRHLKERLLQAAPDLILIDLTGLPLAEVRTRAASLPDDAVILYTSLTDDGAGTTYLPYEAVSLIAEVANRPILVDVENRIDRGATGGSVIQPALIGQEAAELVLRIFSGESPSDIPIGISQSARPVFDWRQLKRWGISEAQLPPGSEIRFREPAIWEQYRFQILLVVITLLVQSALIGGLLYEDRRRRRAEARSLELSTELAHVNRVATAGELAASIAHEIRQPLAAIVARGSAGLNWLKRTTPDLDKVRGALQNIVENGHRADEVLRNTRAMFGKEETPQGTVNVNKVIKDVLALTWRKLGEKGIRLVTSFVDVPPLVRANPVQLQQVLLNLIMNAIEAMATMRDTERVLRLTTEFSSSGHVLITVRDSGPGIACGQLDQIFKSFFTTKPSGMGVGLSICKTIIEAHGGQLSATHGDPVGMVFTIDLPPRPKRQLPTNGNNRVLRNSLSRPDAGSSRDVGRS